MQEYKENAAVVDKMYQDQSIEAEAQEQQNPYKLDYTVEDPKERVKIVNKIMLILATLYVYLYDFKF